MSILSVGAAGQGVFQYPDADAPMTLVGEGSIGDALVIQPGSQVRPQAPGGGGSLGDVSRNGASIDNRLARWHGSNAEIQNSVSSLDDSGNLSGINNVTMDGDLIITGGTFSVKSPSVSTDIFVLKSSNNISLMKMRETGAGQGNFAMRNASNVVVFNLDTGGGTDNYFNAGDFGIGLTNPAEQLHVDGNVLVDNGTLTVNSDADGTTVLGHAKIGSIGGDTAYFAHFDHFNATDYGFSQTASGATGFNAIAGQNASIAIGGVPELTVTGATVLILTNDLSVDEGDLDVTLGDLLIGGTSRLAGNVKIGAAGAPGQMLHLERADASVMQMMLENTDTLVGYGASAGLMRIFVAGVEKIRGNATGFTFNQGLADTNFNVRAVGETGALFLRGSDGYLGVGTLTPDERFSVLDKFLVTDDGDTFWKGAGTGLPYGDMYANDNSTPMSVSSAGYTQVTIFDTNGNSNLLTPDHTNDHHTIVKAGVYKVLCGLTVANNAGAGHKVEFVIAKNNGTVIFANCKRHRTLSSGTDVGAMLVWGYIDVAASDTIEVWASSNSVAAKNITVEDINLGLMMGGGT